MIRQIVCIYTGHRIWWVFYQVDLHHRYWAHRQRPGWMTRPTRSSSIRRSPFAAATLRVVDSVRGRHCQHRLWIRPVACLPDPIVDCSPTSCPFVACSDSHKTECVVLLLPDWNFDHNIDSLRNLKYINTTQLITHLIHLIIFIYFYLTVQLNIRISVLVHHLLRLR